MDIENVQKVAVCPKCRKLWLADNVGARPKKVTALTPDAASLVYVLECPACK